MKKAQRITTNLTLAGAPWQEARDIFCQHEGKGILFDTAAELFVFCAAIGVRIGKATDEFPVEEGGQPPIGIPYSVLLKEDISGYLADLYSAILFNGWLEPDWSDIDRLKQIFGEEGAPSTRHRMLLPYARTGVLHLLECTKGRGIVKGWPLIHQVWSDLAELYGEPHILKEGESPEDE